MAGNKEKLNETSQPLRDCELNQVSGGVHMEISKDHVFFNPKGSSHDSHDNDNQYNYNSNDNSEE